MCDNASKGRSCGCSECNSRWSSGYWERRGFNSPDRGSHGWVNRDGHWTSGDGSASGVDAPIFPDGSK